ncbi:MAG: hypothetical protein D6798_03875 [Deltaproteobacteria bacterium]|nr:MAG: hypothetical protein D6798_03875 [Deltaproteobacteria bacterium]
MRGGEWTRRLAGAFALACLLLLGWAAWMAPEHLSPPDASLAYASPAELPPLGADNRGRPLTEYAMQGARVVALPSVAAGLVVMGFAVLGGLLACVGSSRVGTVIQALGEVVGALPRMLVILVVALVIPKDARGLLPLALTWAVLSAPGAMDEAAAVASRLGGARFVEALRAHGYRGSRIYGWHVVALNLRPVVVRQGAEVMMQVVFLEIALSYLAVVEDQPSFTHADSLVSWADLLNLGYPSLVLDVPSMHALVLGLALIGIVAAMSLCLGVAARAR